MASDGGSNGGPANGSSVTTLVRWLRTRSQTEKAALLGAAALLTLIVLWYFVEDHDNLFIIAETVHFIGIGVLVYKLTQEKSCSGLSLKSQILTAIFLAIRLMCSFVMEYDVHTVLDLLTLVATGFVIYVIMNGSSGLRATYMKEQDSMSVAMVLVPCTVVAIIAHPSTNHALPFRILWATCVYVEAVSVLPQLHMFRGQKTVERFTAHYVFALGVARFFSCAHWFLQMFDGDSFLLSALGSGLWPIMVLLSEIVQTFILADFCYYYVKGQVTGGGVVRLPVDVV